MGNLNWVDAALAAIIVFNAALGLRRGVFREAFNLGGICLGLFAALRLYEALGWNLEGWLGAKPPVANLAAFVVVFGVITFGASYVGYLLHKGAKKIFMEWLDRLAGGVFGFLRGLIFASVAALAFALFPFFPKLERDLGASLLGPHVIKVAPALYGAIMDRARGKGRAGFDIKKWAEEYVGGGTAEPGAGKGAAGTADEMGPRPPAEAGGRELSSD